MTKHVRFTSEQLEELTQAYKKRENAHAHRRIQALVLSGEGKTIKEIMAITKFSYSTVCVLKQKYLAGGLAALLADARTGNNHYLTFEEEELFLETFIQQAEQGLVVTTKEMHLAYQEKVGKNTSSSAFYSLLHRHEWRKIMPRPKHPKKADAETIEASKKLTQKSKKK